VARAARFGGKASTGVTEPAVQVRAARGAVRHARLARPHHVVCRTSQTARTPAAKAARSSDGASGRADSRAPGLQYPDRIASRWRTFDHRRACRRSRYNRARAPRRPRDIHRVTCEQLRTSRACGPTSLSARSRAQRVDSMRVQRSTSPETAQSPGISGSRHIEPRRVVCSRSRAASWARRPRPATVVAWIRSGMTSAAAQHQHGADSDSQACRASPSGTLGCEHVLKPLVGCGCMRRPRYEARRKDLPVVGGPDLDAVLRDPHSRSIAIDGRALHRPFDRDRPS